jgi:hypothetical protein
MHELHTDFDIWNRAPVMKVYPPPYFPSLRSDYTSKYCPIKLLFSKPKAKYNGLGDNKPRS